VQSSLVPGSELDHLCDLKRYEGSHGSLLSHIITHCFISEKRNSCYCYRFPCIWILILKVLVVAHVDFVCWNAIGSAVRRGSVKGLFLPVSCQIVATISYWKGEC